jgi:hypothetical protein
MQILIDFFHAALIAECIGLNQMLIGGQMAGDHLKNSSTIIDTN